MFAPKISLSSIRLERVKTLYQIFTHLDAFSGQIYPYNPDFRDPEDVELKKEERWSKGERWEEESRSKW
jgi:hypothetical protein